MTAHALVLTDRGSEHRHRWAPSCSCGEWTGVSRRRQAEAVEQHRQHATAQDLQGKPSPGRPRKRKVTPRGQLPEALR